MKTAQNNDPLASQPLFVRIPRNGDRDPVFGMSRAFWYALENKVSSFKLKRIKMTSGAAKGVTMIPVRDAWATIERMSK